VIIGNFIYSNTRDGVSQSGDGGHSPFYATIQGNNITSNQRYGISIWQFSNVKVIHNRVTYNGGTTYKDIYVDVAHSSTNRPNISFNVYDDIDGNLGVGQYNVTDRGLAAPAP
jgi:parallel beta-helix repeat protein